jgi:phosphate:Na+ symporter
MSAKNEKTRNIALACMGFALIFYGLNLMTGGLRPLRGMPEVMSVISSLKADNFVNLAYCILIAAFITALIHSSSATIGIVMGLGAAGVLDWQTAVAFSLGADLGTTITSWMASWNLSKNAKRAAYAHITFNILGVAFMFPLFFVSMKLLVWAMGWFGGDPGVAVLVDGKETFPLVPVAVGLYSTAFNVFNTALMFPFISVFDRVLSRIGHSDKDDVEDYTQPRFLDPGASKDMAAGVTAVQRETGRYLEGAGKLLAIARGAPGAPDDAEEHFAAIDVLSREIRRYTAAMFQPEMTHAKADLLASLIEEEDWTASLGETLYQIARRVERQPFSPVGRPLVDETLDMVASAMGAIVPDSTGATAIVPDLDQHERAILAMRDRCLRLGAELPWAERGAILTLLGSAERAFYLIDRIVAERRSVSRDVATQADERRDRPLGGMQPSPVPAE